MEEMTATEMLEAQIRSLTAKCNQLEEKQDSMENQLRRADEKIGAANSKIDGSQKKALQACELNITKRFRMIVPEVAEKTLVDFDDDLKHMHVRLRALIHKEILLTELGRMCYRNMVPLDYLPKIIDAYEETDEWWEKRSNYTLGRWYSELFGETEEIKNAVRAIK